jgi:2-polyprenyl-3-methyl-5-hydroxy-6-metoxy-1,4-benzoquinol methylase
MSKSCKFNSREYGLDIGLNFLEYFFETDHLHYGMFDDLEVKIQNISKAQKNYQDYLVNHIPKDAKSILDVGCGSGKLFETLSMLGCSTE